MFLFKLFQIWFIGIKADDLLIKYIQVACMKFKLNGVDK